MSEYSDTDRVVMDDETETSIPAESSIPAAEADDESSEASDDDFED